MSYAPAVLRSSATTTDVLTGWSAGDAIPWASRVLEPEGWTLPTITDGVVDLPVGNKYEIWTKFRFSIHGVDVQYYDGSSYVGSYEIGRNSGRSYIDMWHQVDATSSAQTIEARLPNTTRNSYSLNRSMMWMWVRRI